MSKRSSHPRFRGSSNVIPLNPPRTANRQIDVVVVALALALVLVALTTAAGLAVESADGYGGTVQQQGSNAAADAAVEYFPAQYQNQATEPAEHIPAF